MPPTLSHRLEYALGRGLEALVSALPRRSAERLGERVGGLVHGALGIRRVMVEENLRHAFGDASPEWIRTTTRDAYRHLGREAATLLRLSRLDAEEVVRRTEISPADWAEFQEVLAEGKGAILVTGHFGNWEIAAAAVASRGIPVAAIIKRLGNRLLDARLEALRARLGVESIEMHRANQEVPRFLRRGGVVGIVGDQDARRSGVFVPFLGRPASTHRGPALFSLRLDAPVYACVARRLPGGEGCYAVRGHRVAVERTGDLAADVARLTAQLAAALEAEIVDAPEQYFWFHRRWKTRPREEPAHPPGVRDPKASTPSRAIGRDA